ncbi:uncharacterized protein BO80DRAFT_428751 [Aspergillus ibericus CBS 121593]|uniref:Uncharacterized protein n=1 Tax=Aspergillus ibericus CBS 121593 TaxID=1448316 RepID=A0A395GNG3_9EURO|nr:hypothetical protein BO80DRAFT_428751 [Aspergillus ibericus CBS 121593]RAK96924.1 hypothetical protein BO80DRAFT_428751 [Aspergillus ibericus CBS 121593]
MAGDCLRDQSPKTALRCAVVSLTLSWSRARLGGWNTQSHSLSSQSQRQFPVGSAALPTLDYSIDRGMQWIARILDLD